MNNNNSDFTNCVEEILAYIDECSKNPDYDYSYYDLKAYAALNKPDWYHNLMYNKNVRILVASYLKDAKRKADVSYKKTFAQSVLDCLDAQIQRGKEIEKKQIEEMEKSQEAE